MSIETIQKYIPYLDEVYAAASRTAILDAPPELVRETAVAGTVMVAEMAMSGLGNYDRTKGFVSGDASLTWVPHQFTHDRGRSFHIDNMDNVETVGVMFAKLASEFIRTKVVPEIDAVRFATYATGSGHTVAGATLTEDTALSAVDTGIAAVKDAGVDLTGGILYLTPQVKNLMKRSSKFTWSLQPGDSPNREFLTYDTLRVVEVPSLIFNTAVTLYDGTTSDQEAGGFVTSGKGINFMIVDPHAVTQITKHAKLRTFDPDVNQSADAYKVDYRIYHDAWVGNNKKMGIYAHTKA